MPARTVMAGKTPAASRARRQRGYNWEGTIVKRFNALDGWSARRLGSPSISLPDVLALNPEESSAFIMEAKSGTTNRLVVPIDQLERCIMLARDLGPFRTTKIVLAFKFLSKRRIGRGEYGGRQLREYYREWDASARPIECVCHYDGTMYGRDGGEHVSLELADSDVPIARTRASQGI